MVPITLGFARLIFNLSKSFHYYSHALHILNSIKFYQIGSLYESIQANFLIQGKQPIQLFKLRRLKQQLINEVNWRRQWQPTLVLLPGKSHGWRSLASCSPWGLEESDTTEQLHFHFSLSCVGEGNGNPLQCSCLENPRDRGAWWAAVYGVAQSWTRLKRRSSNEVNIHLYLSFQRTTQEMLNQVKIEK